jgi:hypothetical protein
MCPVPVLYPTQTQVRLHGQGGVGDRVARPRAAPLADLRHRRLARRSTRGRSRRAGLGWRAPTGRWSRGLVLRATALPPIGLPAEVRQNGDFRFCIFTSYMDCDLRRIYGSRTELTDSPTRGAVLETTKACFAYGLRLNYVADLYSPKTLAKCCATSGPSK